MSDVEYILEANHRRARERELGERWDKIIRQRKRKSDGVALTAPHSKGLVVQCWVRKGFGMQFVATAL